MKYLLPVICLVLSGCGSHEDRYQIISGTFNNRFTKENEALIIKIDTHTGRAWKLRAGQVPLYDSGVEGWQPIPEDYDAAMNQAISRHFPK